MLMLSSSLVNRPIISLRTGTQIAVARGPVINPHNLKIIGWWCVVAGGKNKILLAEDVRETTLAGLTVNHEEDLSDPSDLVRHKEILNIKFELLDKLVRTKRFKLGKISDYSYNEGLFVQKLYVTKPLRKILSTEDTLLIDRDQILEVTDKYILVRDTEVAVGAEDMASAPVVPA